jgi:PBP superfamily domain
MNRNFTIAAAVAAALSSAASFAGPSIQTINATPAANTINIMGSSAIKTALTNSILANFCGGAANATQITSNGTNTNFLGIACTPAAGQASHSGNYNVWIRYEGGSVSGYLPIVNPGFLINEISGPALTATPITVNGNSETNGANDSFSVSAGGALVRVAPDLGIGDVEPGALINNNYPTDYVTSVWGPVNQTGLFGLKANGIIDEVYALFVNQVGTVITENPMSLSQETIASILTHQVTNWNQVLDTSMNPVASGSLAITLVNREFGSGSRTATDVLEVGDGCGSSGLPTTLFNKSTASRYFATGDVLAAANSVAGAITYATIDNAGADANLKLVSINGVAPSNLAAAEGVYPFWVEAQYVNNTATTGHDSTAVNNIIQSLQTLATTAAIADVNAIPNVVSATGTPATLNTTVHLNPSLGGVVPSGGGSTEVYTNPYTRQGVTCHNPAFSATVVP